MAILIGQSAFGGPQLEFFWVSYPDFIFEPFESSILWVFLRIPKNTEETLGHFIHPPMHWFSPWRCRNPSISPRPGDCGECSLAGWGPLHQYIHMNLCLYDLYDLYAAYIYYGIDTVLIGYRYPTRVRWVPSGSGLMSL